MKLARRPEATWLFIKPYYGVHEGMSFAELCRWLSTPYGSDAFANRHWLSQHRQLRLPDGRLPDFIGRYERLDTDWETVTARLGLPARALPRVNVRPEGMTAEEHLDGGTQAISGSADTVTSVEPPDRRILMTARGDRRVRARLVLPGSGDRNPWAHMPLEFERHDVSCRDVQGRYRRCRRRIGAPREPGRS